MTAKRLTRWSGAAAAIGGVLWIVFAVLAAGEPRGCVGDECLVRLHRDLSGLEPLFYAGALLILAGLAGVIGVARRAGAAVGLLRAAAAAVLGGTALVVAGVLAGAIWSWDGFWYALVTPGLVAWTAGFALAGLALARSTAAPRRLGALLLVASVALLAANDQDARVLLLIPFGTAWTLLGVALIAPAWSRKAAPARAIAP
jgi:hypothetical protein